MKSASSMDLWASLLTLSLMVGQVSLGQAEDLSPVVREQIQAIQAEKAARTTAQRKLDSQLLYLSRERAGLNAIAAVSDLKSRVELEKDGRVLVDIATVPGARLGQAITAAGGTILYESPRWQALRASLPPGSLPALAALTDVQFIRCADRALIHTGPVNSAGDATHRASFARTNSAVNGAGIKVGIISDSVDYLVNSIAAGELPASFSVVPGRAGFGSGEGTAMAQVVHDLAPGAELWFATGAAGGPASVADSILQLRSRGCRIIVDDITYISESPFQDDVIAQALNQVVTDGALYFSAAGNGGSLKRGTSSTWEGDFADGGPAGAPLPAGRVHSFGAQNLNRISANSANGLVSLHWSDEARSSANDYDLFILNSNGTAIVSASTNPQDGDDRPNEVVFAQVGERVMIWKAATAAPRYLRLSRFGGRFETATAGNTPGHVGAVNCIAVASSDAGLAYPGPFNSASPVSGFSSDGPRKTFYQPDGTPISPGNFLASGGMNISKPNLTAADGVATSVPGFSPFYGTSAAAAHAAAIAAIVWSKNPGLTGAQVRAILNASCIDNEDPGFDINAGQGILMADLALANTPAPNTTPTNLIAVVNGTSLNLSWPEDHTGWRLLAQTNHLAVGISTNLNDWATVSGSTVTNRISVLIDLTKPSRFYRLTYP